ncbi:GPI transamidase component PIG-S isoform X2 [Pectinophora gossypiella]|uniref:GPI transamidase component PIG-S isoform X2 n=1 Tax=Pectinophora gossypiella TaxID=13191 RepID=UPI00214E6032|nr:GPI transamidase component PIG-S isoform X2 [Pectinophora gossypiella]
MLAESNRMWASASFVGVLIIIGLPLWWKTTEVYRVALPYDKISSFDALPHSIASEVKVLANDEATAAEISGLIEKAFEDSELINLKVTKAVLSDDLHHTLNSVADEQEAVEEVAGRLALSAHNQLLLVQRTPLFQDCWLAQERLAFFRDATAAPTIVQVLKQWVYQTKVLAGVRTEVADAARRTRFPPGDRYHVVLSVVQPRPGSIAVEFDAKEAVEDYIGSFVDELSVLHNFTLKSQWLYLLDFDFQAREVKDNSEWGRHWAVRQDRLPLLLTRLEERAATHVSEAPTINLALYATPCERAPLVIYDHDDKPIISSVEAFMSPKWGGVVLSSPTAGECRGQHQTHKPVTRVVMGAFVSQLRKLLGIVETEHIQGAHLEPLRSVVPRRWELDNLLHLRTIELITSAERTLQSLAQLLGEISNIVINDDVGASINLAVDSIHQASALMAQGRLVEAYKTSQQAFQAAETAFMEPSLLALLYFPDDQKYAIYIPLFLPIMFPVVLSLKNLLLWFRGKPIHKKMD